MTTHSNNPTELNENDLEGVQGGGLLLPAVQAAREAARRSDQGSFEIQNLMARYNQSETLASSVQKKKDDTGNAVIGKV